LFNSKEDKDISKKSLHIIEKLQQVFTNSKNDQKKFFTDILEVYLELLGSDYGFFLRFKGQKKYLHLLPSDIHIKTSKIWQTELEQIFKDSLYSGILWKDTKGCFYKSFTNQEFLYEKNISEVVKNEWFTKDFPKIGNMLISPLVYETKTLGFFVSFNNHNFLENWKENLALVSNTCAFLLQQLKEAAQKSYTEKKVNKLLKHTYQINEKLNEQQAALNNMLEQTLHLNKALERNIHFLKESQKMANLGSWEYYPDTKKVFFTEELYHLLGISEKPQTISLKTYQEFIQEDDKEKFRKALKKCHNSQDVIDLISRFKIEGKIYHIKQRLVGVFKKNKLNKIWGIHLDISEQTDLTFRHKQLGKILENSLNEIYIFDLETLKFIYVSKQAILNTGFSLEEFQSMSPFDIKPYYSEETFLEQLNLLLTGTNDIIKFDTLHKRKNETTYDASVTLQLTNYQGKKAIVAFVLDTSKIKKAEKEIQKLDFIAKNTANGVVISNAEGRIEWINEGFERITEYKLKDVKGKKPGSFLQGPESSEKVIQFMSKRIKAQKPFKVELINYTKSGKKYWVQVDLQPIFNEFGELKQFFALQTDITSRKNVEDKLLESETQLREVFDAMPQSYFLINKYYKIVKFNRLAIQDIKDFFGVDLKIGDNILKYAEPKSLEAFKTNMEKALKGEKITVVREITHKNKQIRWYEVQYLPTYNSKSKIYAVAFVSMDITRRKNTENILRRSFQEIKNFKNALYQSAAIMTIGLDKKILEVNEAFCKITQYDTQEVIGKKYDKIINEEISEFFWNRINLHIKSNQYWKGEIRGKAKDGTIFWIDTTINPIFDERDKLYKYLTVNYLITEKKKVAEQRESLIKDLTKFAHITSHKLRRPLANILGLVSLFNTIKLDDEFNKTIIDKIKIASQELDTVIHQMNAVLDKEDD